MKIFILGIKHLERGRIVRIGEKIKPDAIFYECIRRDKFFTKKNFLKDPFFMFSFIPYSLLLLLLQRDYKAVREISKKRKIKVHAIDLNNAEFFQKGYRWYNGLVFSFIILSIFTYLYLFSSINLLSFTLGIFVTTLIYLYYFALLKANYDREKKMANSSSNIMKRFRYKKPLLICGSKHKNNIKGYLTEMGFEVQDAKIFGKKTFLQHRV